MKDLCVKLFNSWSLKIDFLFPLRVSTIRIEPRSHHLFLPKRELYGKPQERGCLICDFALILLKPAIIFVSVNCKVLVRKMLNQVNWKGLVVLIPSKQMCFTGAFECFKNHQTNRNNWSEIKWKHACITGLNYDHSSIKFLSSSTVA